MKFLNPCADPIFKALMTDNSPEARSALTSLTSTIIGRKVSNVELLPNELPGQSDTDKQAVFDLTCVLDGKERANIEMQGVNIFNAYDNRVEYHVAHLFQYSVPKGQSWNKVEKVFQISLLNFIYSDIKKHPDVLIHFAMQSEDGIHLGDRMNVYFIELPKAENMITDVKNLTSVERWATYFRHASDESKQDLIKELTKCEEGIMNAQTVLNRISTDDIMWVQQKHYFDAVAREATIRDEGYEEGMAEGRAEGSHAKAVEAAQKMIQLEMSVDLISQITGLSNIEIESLK